MSQTKSIALLAGAALSLGGVNAALAQQTTNTDEVRAIVAEMIADAETRSSLLAGGDAGYDDGFHISSSDGAFRLNIGGMVQFRYYLNFRDEDNTVGGDDFDPGFELSRTKLRFNGHIHNDWLYYVEGDFDTDGGSFTLEDAWIGYEWENGFTTYFGQFKAPLLREELIRGSHQLAADRSEVNEFFTAGRAQGVLFAYNEEAWRFKGSVNDGANTANTGFTSGAEGDLGLSGRFEYKFDGDWAAFDDFTSPVGSDFAAMIGAAVHWDLLSTPSGSNTSNPGDTDTWSITYTVDLSLEGDSWNVYAAVIGDHTEARTAGSDVETDDFGVIAQGGYRFTEDTEGFVRYDGLFLDDERGLDDDNFHFITFGINQYYAGHAAKATVDVVVALSETDELVGVGNNGGLPDTETGILGNSESGEVVIRFQLQLLF